MLYTHDATEHSDHVVGILCVALTLNYHIELSQRPVSDGKMEERTSRQALRWTFGGTYRQSDSWTDRTKIRQTDGQLIDQTYIIYTDRNMLEGLKRESTHKKDEQTDRWT